MKKAAKKLAKEAAGKRGRTAVDGATDVERTTITLTKSDREKLRALGGSPWVRRAIREAYVAVSDPQRGGSEL